MVLLVLLLLGILLCLYGLVAFIKHLDRAHPYDYL